MTDAQRAVFANLILLCSAHHKMVDRIAPDAHPVAVLEAWKAENEVTLELECGLIVPSGGVMTSPDLATIEKNPGHQPSNEELAARPRDQHPQHRFRGGCDRSS